MEDEGFVISTLPYGNSSLIVKIFSKERGKITAFLKGGTINGKERINIGSHIVFGITRRLAEHMGTLKFETIKEFALFFIKDKHRSFLLSTICEILFFFLPEEAQELEIYNKVLKIIELAELSIPFQDLLKEYALFELDILKYMGFGIDVSQCALTGSKSNLFFLSPLTGKGATFIAGSPFKKKLFIIPKIFGNVESEFSEILDIKAAFVITTHFLQQLPGFEKLLSRKLLLKD